MTAPQFTVSAPAAVLDRVRPVVDRGRSLPRWPLILIALPAAVAVWSGWVGLGTMCGFGIVHPLPGIWDSFKLNTAITLPIGVEAYGAYALAAWLHPGTGPAAKQFAQKSGIGALVLGMAGQVIYHLLTAWHVTAAPWPVVTLVSCLPVLTLGFGTALTHLMRTAPADDEHPTATAAAPVVDEPNPAAAIEADSTPDAPAVTDADSTPAIESAPVADTGADTTPDSTPAKSAAPKRPRRGPSTADRVARMRDKHPGESAAEIAKRLDLSPRTVRRYLPQSDDTARAAAA